MDGLFAFLGVFTVRTIFAASDPPLRPGEVLLGTVSLLAPTYEGERLMDEHVIDRPMRPALARPTRRGLRAWIGRVERMMVPGGCREYEWDWR